MILLLLEESPKRSFENIKYVSMIVLQTYFFLCFHMYLLSVEDSEPKENVHWIISNS
jgi:hypothetical protein